MDRPVCEICCLRPCYVNYRSRRKATALEGVVVHVKKNRCERCVFHSEFAQVFAVHFLDGNLKNCRPNNIRTVV